MDKKLLDLYSDYLMVSTSLVTSTGLSNILDNEISHDKITRFLSGEPLTSKDLWNKVKKVVRQVESDDGVLCFDDSVEEKAYTDENDLICWHRDHSIIKGINQLTMLYYSTGVSVPVALDFVKKTNIVIDKKTGKEKRISEKTKNEYFREMFKVCVFNKMNYCNISSRLKNLYPGIKRYLVTHVTQHLLASNNQKVVISVISKIIKIFKLL